MSHRLPSRVSHPVDLVAMERFLHRKLRAYLNAAVEGLGLSYSQVEVLLMLEDRPNMIAGQIARRLGITRQSAHALVRNLELASLVDVLPKDGAGRAVALTPLGRKRVARAWTILERTVFDALRRMPEDERTALLKAMDRCERSLAPVRPPWWLD